MREIRSITLRRDVRSDAGIRRLTILAGVIGPLTLINGLYATNFQTPGTQVPGSFWAFVGVQVVFLVVAVVYLRGRGLL